MTTSTALETPAGRARVAQCHLCDARAATASFAFGLARAADDLQNSITAAFVARLVLQVCQPCARRRRGFFGRVSLRRRDYVRHPDWSATVADGFETLLPPGELENWRSL